MDRTAQEATDTWNYLNCDMILGKYPPTYINPMRKYNKESWGNIKLTIEDPDSIAHRCHHTRHDYRLPKVEEGK
jgi:hypothetical protein